jgi:hypothetical protein
VNGRDEEQTGGERPNGGPARDAAEEPEATQSGDGATARLGAPGPSYLKELELRPGGPFRVGMSVPQTMAEEWWVAMLWCERDGHLALFSDLAPICGIPPGSPLMRLGPGLSGTLAGLIMEEGGRQQLRLRLGRPSGNEGRPWEAPIAVLAGFRFEPARAATMRGNELALTVLRAFRDALLRLSY